MMRGPGSAVTCVRTLSGEILTRREAEILPQGRRRWTRFPVLRGMPAVYESLLCGMRAFLFFAGASGEDEEPLTGKEAASRNFSEELLRLALFPGCIWSVSRRKEMRRVLEYHGAEHKAIRCLEKRLSLTTANVRAQSRLHPRCGTNFLMMVMLLGLFAFSFFGGPPFYARVLLRLALLPVIAGLAYEWIRFAADSGSPLVRALNRPGLWLELLTTRAPHDDQMKVAAAALRGAAGLADAAAARAE